MTIHIYCVIKMSSNVKSDHRSKFSNLSNWKVEAWKKKRNQDFNGIRTHGLRGGHGFESRWSTDFFFFFFRLLLSNCLNWKIYCDDHSSHSSTTAVQIWIISYIFHKMSLLSMQLTEIDATNESAKLSFSWRRHLESCRNLTPIQWKKNCKIGLLYFSATNYLSRRIIRLVTTARATSIVLLFPGGLNTHDFFCRLQSDGFYTASLFQTNHVVHWNAQRADIFQVVFVVMTFRMFIHNMFVLLQRSNNLNRAHNIDQGFP